MLQRPHNRRVASIAAVALVGVLFSIQLLRTSGKPRKPPISDLRSLLTAAENGDAVALRTLGSPGGLPENEIIPLLPQMFRSTRPEIRAAACNHAESSFLPAVFPRMSDNDWRVRASAFAAVRRLIGHLGNAPAEDPLRDSPVDQRERQILQWHALWNKSGDAPRLCDLYAAKHWLAGETLAAECLSCHAPPTGFVEADFADCARCHYPQHRSWFDSAHARSSTHLNLARVNQQTKLVERFDFKSHEGLDCVACHQVDERSNAALPTGTENSRVPHRFVRPAAVTCASCHEDTHRQWQTWAAHPRPAMATFPPGEISFDGETPAKSCVDCHMPGDPVEQQSSSHAFAARRDQAFMAAGLHARIEPASEGRGAELVLTNLAGHAYPSGTARRALRIEVMFDDDPGTLQFLMRLCEPLVPTPEPTQPPLRPGEQRRIAMPSRAASRFTCIVTFERNYAVDESYEVEVARVSGSVGS